MKAGAVFPTVDIGNDPIAIRDYAQTAEDLGYAQILTYDHVLGAEHANRDPALLEYGYDETHPFHEPFVLFAFLAGQTSKIEFSTGVLVLPQRQTALVAKQAAELSLLSNGRLRLGVGTGWNWVEYESLGVSFERTGNRLDEQIDLMRRLWSGEVTSFHGDFHDIERATVLPAPAGRIPVLIGGFTVRPFRRAAQVGDGFIFPTWRPPMADGCRMLWEEVDKAGRSRGELEVEVLVHHCMGEDGWLNIAREWRALGATRISLNTMNVVGGMGDEPTGFTTPREHMDALNRFVEVVRDV